MGSNQETPRENIHIAGAGGPEKTDLVLGFVPLTDCAVLAIAKEKGFFSKYGLNVTLSREPSWANIRDKVAIGALDGAQMLAGIPIASTLGINTWKKPTVTAFSMGLNGNAVTVSNSLYRQLEEIDPDEMGKFPHSALPLKKLIENNARQGHAPLTFAHVFPVSSHNYELRYWLASAGIDPDNDARLIVIPPHQMPENIKAGTIDGFCVGEPWNEYTVKTGLGRTLITGYEIWNNAPEKVFGVNRDWAERHPNCHISIVCALLDAAEWIDRKENRMEVVEIISREEYVNAPVDIVKMSMTGTFCYGMDDAPVPLADFNVFSRYAANFPWCSHAEWFITQMYRWGQIDKAYDIKKIASEIYQPEIYRQAARITGHEYPLTDHKGEGMHPDAWNLGEATVPIQMGADRFHDGLTFNPSDLMGYLQNFQVHHFKIDLDDLARLNP